MKIMYAVSSKAVAELIDVSTNIVNTILNPVPFIVEDMEKKNFVSMFITNPDYTLGILRLTEKDVFVNIGEPEIEIHPIVSYTAYSFFRNPGDVMMKSNIKDIQNCGLSAGGKK